MDTPSSIFPKHRTQEVNFFDFENHLKMKTNKIRKTILGLMLLWLCFPIFSQESNNYEVLDKAKLMVNYKLTWRNDSTTPKIGKQENMILLIGNETSSFQSLGYYRYREFQMSNHDASAIEYERMVQETTSNISYRIYKNHPKGRITVMEYVPFTGYFEYAEDIPNFNWEIMEDTMRIEGYLAQKAVCEYGGRTWEAWFTEELPFNDGPYKFCGLPGLILNMIDARRDYRFFFQSIEVPEEGTTIKWENKETVKTTKKGLFKVLDQSAESVMRNFDERTSTEAQKNIYYGMKANNNPIELDRK